MKLSRFALLSRTLSRVIGVLKQLVRAAKKAVVDGVLTCSSGGTLRTKKIVIRRAHLQNNKHGLLISIKSLEFFCVIVNFAAAICALAAGHVTIDDVHPVLLNWCDNISVCAWVNYKCKESLIVR